jgi:hypothetical protein
MLRLLATLGLLVTTAPALAEPEVLHIRDPFEPCEKVTEKERYGLTSLLCGKDAKVNDAVWLVSFDLGRWSAPYSRFTVRGGAELETIGRPHASVGSCRRGCTFYQVESVVIPFHLLFSAEAMTTGLQIQAVGGPQDVYLTLPPERIQRFRQGLITAKFIEDDANPASWHRDFKWPEPKRDIVEPPAGS